MLAMPWFALSLAFAGDIAPPPDEETGFQAEIVADAAVPSRFETEGFDPERFQPVRASAWILAEQASLFVFNGWIVRPPAWKPPSYDLFLQAWTDPTLDSDDDGFAMNAFMHPCMGAHFYMTARNHGFSSSQAAMVTILGSFVWEYVIESWFTRPVVFDLITTPMLGVPLGMLISHIKVPIRRIGPRWLRGLALIPLDPAEGIDTLVFGGPPRPASW